MGRVPADAHDTSKRGIESIKYGLWRCRVSCVPVVPGQNRGALLSQDIRSGALTSGPTSHSLTPCVSCVHQIEMCCCSRIHRVMHRRGHTRARRPQGTYVCSISSYVQTAPSLGQRLLRFSDVTTRSSTLSLPPYQPFRGVLAQRPPNSPMRAGDELEILPHTVCYPRPDDFRLGLPH